MKQLVPVVVVCAGLLAACGSDRTNPFDAGLPPDVIAFNPGNGGSGGGYGYGYGGGPTAPDATVTVVDSGPPACPVSQRLCGEVFTYPYDGQTSVSVMGNYSATGWTVGTPMVHSGSGPYGSEWYALIPVPYDQPVQYKFQIDGSSTWVTDPNNPNVVDAGDGNTNSVDAPLACTDYTCAAPPVPPAGVFDWRDAIIYFAFIDRFFDGDPSNNCSVSGASTAEYTSANYLGGDWAGVTQKLNAGYFKSLGVNTLWITVPVKNADDALGAGVGSDCSGTSCQATSYEYTGYHGYWPSDPTSIEPCFGTESDLHTLVQTAHAQGIKVLFDYAMVDIDTESSIYQQHVNDTPSWFTQDCQCGAPSCSDYDDYKCWFAPYLAHFDFTNSSAARTYSVNAALGLVSGYKNDAFRLDAIKQVDPSWLGSLRPQITSYESQVADGGNPQHFYMVGETYDFDDMAYIRSFIDPDTQLDGQFDFPLRYRIVQAVLLRDSSPMLDPNIADGNPWTYTQPGGMQGLASFMDYNDAFYPSDAVMSTFIGNHDLPRSIHYAEQTLPSWLGANVDDALTTDGSGNAWVDEPATETDPNTYARLANAFAVILTNKGAPLIYYGDEIGMPGAGDPDNRRMKPWSGLSAAQTTLLAQVSKLTAIRAAHPAMRRGTRTTLYVDQDFWVYSVSTSSGLTTTDTAYVAINRSDDAETTTEIPAGTPNLIAGGTATGNDMVPPRMAYVWSSYVAPTGDGGADGG